jgi:hypothetical protein
VGRAALQEPERGGPRHHRHAWNGWTFFGLKSRGGGREQEGPEAHAKKPALVRKLRCAVYTRKSSEEGLDQEFNSLDAQRQAL